MFAQTFFTCELIISIDWNIFFNLSSVIVLVSNKRSRGELSPQRGLWTYCEHSHVK